MINRAVSLMILVASLSALPTGAMAEHIGHSGEELLQHCETDPHYCETMAMGFVFGHIVTKQAGPNFCIDKDTRPSEFGDALIKFMRENSDKLHKGQIGMLYESMSDFLACD